MKDEYYQELEKRRKELEAYQSKGNLSEDEEGELDSIYIELIDYES